MTPEPSPSKRKRTLLSFGGRGRDGAAHASPAAGRAEEGAQHGAPSRWGALREQLAKGAAKGEGAGAASDAQHGAHGAPDEPSALQRYIAQHGASPNGRRASLKPLKSCGSMLTTALPKALAVKHRPGEDAGDVIELELDYEGLR